MTLLVKQFYTLQEERVHTYNLFEEGHNAYLAAAPNYNFEMFKKVVHEITKEFQRISSEIIEIISRLREANHNAVAAILEQIQEHERKKLELTAAEQVNRQNLIDKPNDVEVLEEAVKLKSKMRELVEEINGQMEELKFESEDLT